MKNRLIAFVLVFTMVFSPVGEIFRVSIPTRFWQSHFKRFC